jgi:hypothetical protein
MTQNDFGLTPEDLALVAGDSPDLEVRARSKITLVQTNSPELVPGDKRHVPGAQVGMYVVPSGDGGRVAVQQVDFVVVGFSHYFDEYLPNRGPWVRPHLKKPSDAVWLDAKRDKNVEKTGLWLPSGNRLVEVILTYMVLTGGQAASFKFYGTGFPVGRDLSDRAASLKAMVGAASVHTCTVGKWRMTSTFEKEADMRWVKPHVALLGKLGEPKGPTIAEWRQAQTLRRAVRDGTPWQEALTSLAAPAATAKPKLTVVEPPKPTAFERSQAWFERRQAWAEGPPLVDNGDPWAEGPPPADPDDPGHDPDGHYPDEGEVNF